MQDAPQLEQLRSVADLINRYSAASSGACSEVLEVVKIPFSANLLNAFMAEAMSFFFSMSQCELMTRRGEVTTERYQQTEREIRRALSELGLKNPDFFLFSMFPSDERFKQGVYQYYRGSVDAFGLSGEQMRDFCRRYQLKTPADDSFEMTVLIFCFQMIKMCRFGDYVDDAVQHAAVRKVIEVISQYVAEFLTLIEECLDAKS